TPLLLEVLAPDHERGVLRSLAVLTAVGLLAIATYAAVPLLARTEFAALIGVTILFALAAVVASRAHLAPALALATVAGVAASVLASIDQLGVTSGILIGMTVLLTIGFSKRHVGRSGAEATSQRLFDATMHLLPLGIIRIDLDGAVHYANPMFKTITGLTA